MELGIVSFFNVERGFGRIKTPKNPKGVFVHFSDVLEEAKILVENELVRFQLTETRRGPKAKAVSRLTPRLKGIITSFDKGYGYIETIPEGETYFLHFSDVKGSQRGFKKIQTGFEVEFSPFISGKNLQAKEVVISDTRSPIEKFAFLGDYDHHLTKLAHIAQPEIWRFPSQKDASFPILANYLNHTFHRLWEENKIAYTLDQRKNQIAAFNTGLVTSQHEEIYAYFVSSKRKSHPKSYIKNPDWVLKHFGLESHRLMTYFKSRPQLANYIQEPADLIFDPSRRLVPDFDHIIGDRSIRLPTFFQTWSKAELMHSLKQAITLSERRVKRNYKTAIPQFYAGSIQLLLPLCLQKPEKADLALIISKAHEVYRANTIIPLEWAYQNARLIAPVEKGWLTDGLEKVD